MNKNINSKEKGADLEYEEIEFTGTSGEGKEVSEELKEKLTNWMSKSTKLLLSLED